jgi:hypothetical protein
MHRYILQPYTGRDSRHTCPQCNHRYRFKRYIDTLFNKPLADYVGRCDRADNCGYHFTPRDYFARNPVGFRPWQEQAYTRPFDTLRRKLVDNTIREYQRNNFVQFLVALFGAHPAITLADRYKIGTSKRWPGATIFWQIDVNDRVRTGKIMLYNRTDGHRVKQPYNHVTWAHSLVGSEQFAVSGEHHANCKPPTANFHLRQCFFGEHLLGTDPFKIVAIAESEKTAVICSFMNPKYIWLASGSLEGINADKCYVLKDRKVILFPDVNGYDKWRMKAREMGLRYPNARFRADNALERTATGEERRRGIDMADRWIEQLLNKS